MIAAIIVLGIALAAVLLIVRELLERYATAEAAWTDERRELLNRIQHPEILPTTSTTPFIVPELEPDDANDVGTIRFDPEAVIDG